jgi:hypothetical protein
VKVKGHLVREIRVDMIMSRVLVSRVVSAAVSGNTEM